MCVCVCVCVLEGIFEGTREKERIVIGGLCAVTSRRVCFGCIKDE